ncbi:ABC transporter permease [Paenibacillus periandrae]|uniref:ABC transporter permease n=1 Tax=Paenibacillus periandrae TaxID=1761741 RepID=UPI001F097774|nr:ABC-2 family transporter protein [Paenibacillus periandrae]
MKTYIFFGLKSFSNNLAYRSEVWLKTIGNFVTIFIQVSIWKAVIGSGSVIGISLEQMVTYSILNTLILSLLLHNVSRKVNDSLTTGSIASELLKPLSYPLYLFSDGLGSVAYQFVFVVIPSFLISWIAFGIKAPVSFNHFVGFIISLLIALILSFFLGYLISLIAFWILTSFSLEWIVGGLLILFSGSFLPLWFYPESWALIARSLPFQFLGYVPAAIYMGYIPKEQIGDTLLIGMTWIAGLFLLVNWLWRKAIRRLVVQGG